MVTSFVSSILHQHQHQHRHPTSKVHYQQIHYRIHYWIHNLNHHLSCISSACPLPTPLFPIEQCANSDILCIWLRRLINNMAYCISPITMASTSLFQESQVIFAAYRLSFLSRRRLPEFLATSQYIASTICYHLHIIQTGHVTLAHTAMTLLYQSRCYQNQFCFSYGSSRTLVLGWLFCSPPCQTYKEIQSWIYWFPSDFNTSSSIGFRGSIFIGNG